MPTVTAVEMHKVDELMVNHYGLQLIQMMENAGRNLAEFTREFLGTSLADKKIVVAVGKGNNGGGGIVAARHLSNMGAQVTILLPKEPLNRIPKTQLEIIHNFVINCKEGEDALNFRFTSDIHLVIDALIGYNLKGNPYGWIAAIIKAINGSNSPVVSLDLPSGLDATTGAIYDPCIKASATMTLALPKSGLMKTDAKHVIGPLYLADIGIPQRVYQELGLNVPSLFSQRSIIKI